jgi:hypothetical protein
MKPCSGLGFGVLIGQYAGSILSAMLKGGETQKGFTGGIRGTDDSDYSTHILSFILLGLYITQENGLLMFFDIF